MSMQKSKHNVLYISHGAGPLPVLGDQKHTEMIENLELISSRIPKPSAIVVVSAHWEADVATVTGASNPDLFYDYYGFPEESYEIQYPAKGNPLLAESIYKELGGNGIECRMDKERGFDHGLFIPLKIMYPEADIPCVQLSLIKGLEPAAHIEVGEALAKVDFENLLILGSGFSFHNMRAFFAPDTPETVEQNHSFERWLIDTCSSNELDEASRKSRLTDWESAPYARYCHPREEHLLPLMVCYGASGKACSKFYELNIFDKRCSTYFWG